MGNISILVTVAAVMFAVLGAITLLAYIYNLNDIKAKTVGQRHYVEEIKKNTIVFGVGPAGTGKTFLAVAMAVKALREKQAAEEAANADPEIDALVAARTEAKKAKNFAEADRIRDELKARGIEIIDTPQGAKWRKV